MEMFGDPIDNPMNWDVKMLKELTIKIISGSTPKGGNQVYVESGITFLRSQNVWKNRLELDDVVYITPEIHLQMKILSVFMSWPTAIPMKIRILNSLCATDCWTL